MQIAVRSTVTAGVALIGAGVIAVSPVAPPTHDLHLPAVHVSAVQLAAGVNPLTQWGQVIAEALQNTKTLAAGVLADPAPVLGQVVKNEFANFGTLGGALRDFMTAFVGQLGNVPAGLKTGLSQVFTGHISDGFQTLFQTVLTPILIPIITIPTFLTDVQGFFVKPVQNLVNVITAAVTPASGVGWVLAAGFPAISVMADTVAATGDSFQRVLDSVKSGNLVGALGAILAIPGTITGALLNGYNDDGGGLLGPNGIVQGLRNALKIIATAIKPTTAQPPVAAASVPAASTGITLSAGETSAAAGKSAVVTKVTTEKPSAATDSDDALATATKKDRRAAHSTHKKSSSSTDDASVAATGQQVTGASDQAAAPTHKTGASSKRDRAGVKNGNSAAAGSRGVHRSHHRAKSGAE